MTKMEFLERWGEMRDSRFIADLTLVIQDEIDKHDAKKPAPLESLIKQVEGLKVKNPDYHSYYDSGVNETIGRVLEILRQTTGDPRQVIKAKAIKRKDCCDGKVVYYYFSMRWMVSEDILRSIDTISSFPNIKLPEDAELVTIEILINEP